MKRRVFLGALGGAVACSSGKPRLNVYNWSEYIAPDTIPNFEQEFGVEVRYGTYETAPEMLAKVMTGNSGWDVVFPPGEYIGPMREMNLLAPLNHGWLHNLAWLAPEFKSPAWDSNLEWCVPYMHGATGIVYRKEAGVASWADLWDARLAGRITMIDEAAEVFGACLKLAGHSVNSERDTELREAAQRATQQKPLLRAYLNAEVVDQVAAGDILAAQAWSVTAGQAMAAAPDQVAFVLPREGFARYADNAAILRESGRAELAHQFVDYLLRPEVAVSIVDATQTMSCNREAAGPMEGFDRGEWFTSHSAASQRLRDRLWTEVKSATG